MRIEPAKRTDAAQITELTLRSKAYWNYDAKHIEAWRDELTTTAKHIDEHNIYKLVDGDTLIGFYAYYFENKTEINLDNFFVAPEYIGQGFGKVLMLDFLKRIESTKAETIILVADPNAEKFYKHMGFKSVGKRESSIKGRFLPIMTMRIKRSTGIL